MRGYRTGCSHPSCQSSREDRRYLPVKHTIRHFHQVSHEFYSTGFKLIEKKNATAPQPQRNVLKYFAIFKMLHSVWSLVRRRETRRLTWLQTMCNVLKYRKT